MDLTDKQRRDVKKNVLEDKVAFLAESLSRYDVDKYVIMLRGEGVLDSNDREVIDHKVTTFNKVEAIVDILKTRRGKKKNEHGLDVLINVLNDGMHSEVAQALQRARHRAMGKIQLVFIIVQH